MVPELVHFRAGAYHADFARFRDRFNSEYRSNFVRDMRGVRILFGDSDFNGDNDCAHVCFGGRTPMIEKAAEDWKPRRAERILWIKAALQDTKRTTVHLGDKKLDREDARVYLYAASDEVPLKSNTQCFMVVTIYKDSNTSYFLTAYDIDRDRLVTDRAWLPRIYPSLRPPKSERKK